MSYLQTPLILKEKLHLKLFNAINTIAILRLSYQTHYIVKTIEK